MRRLVGSIVVCASMAFMAAPVSADVCVRGNDVCATAGGVSVDIGAIDAQAGPAGATVSVGAIDANVGNGGATCVDAGSINLPDPNQPNCPR